MNLQWTDDPALPHLVKYGFAADGRRYTVSGYHDGSIRLFVNGELLETIRSTNGDMRPAIAMAEAHNRV